MKSSKRGTNSLSLVARHSCESMQEIGQITESGDWKNSSMTSPAAISLTAPLQQKVSPYGWKPEYATVQKSYDPHESWLLYQAKSYLGRDVTMEEAKELFSRIDPSTRKPREMPTAPRPVGLLAALRALVAGGMILLASGCTKVPDTVAQMPATGNDVEVLGAAYPAGAISKFYDRNEGVVCYMLVSIYDHSPAISCMVAKPGDGQ